MKKKLAIGFFIFLTIFNLLLAITTMVCKTKLDCQDIKVYSFSGESKDIKITNGTIIISPHNQIFYGGEIQYIGSNTETIQSYSKKFYLNEHGNQYTLLSNSTSFQDNNKVITFLDEFSLNKSIGEISSEKLFSEDNLNTIKDALYFSLDYSKINGEKEAFSLKLNVNEFNIHKPK